MVHGRWVQGASCSARRLPAVQVAGLESACSALCVHQHHTPSWQAARGLATRLAQPLQHSHMQPCPLAPPPLFNRPRRATGPALPPRWSPGWGCLGPCPPARWRRCGSCASWRRGCTGRRAGRAGCSHRRWGAKTGGGGGAGGSGSTDREGLNLRRCREAEAHWESPVGHAPMAALL